MGSMLKPLVHILLLLLLGLITVLSETTDPRCDDVTIDLHACAPVLLSGNLTVASPITCCNALRRIQAGQAEYGVQQTCLCVQNCLIIHILPVGASIYATLDANAVDLSTKMQSDCGVDLGFSISPEVVC